MKFVLAAWNDGDFSEATEHVAPDLTIHVNGFAFEPDGDVDGPTMARQSIEYWRTIAPDIQMKLLQEIRQKEHIAIEWLLTGTHTGEIAELPASGNPIELRGSAFLTLEKDKVVDAATAFDALALAVQTRLRAAGLVAGASVSVGARCWVLMFVCHLRRTVRSAQALPVTSSSVSSAVRRMTVSHPRRLVEASHRSHGIGMPRNQAASVSE